MRTLVNINPLSELRHMAELVDRAFAPLETEQARTALFNVPFDIWERDNRIMIKAAAPGIKPEDLDVTLHEGVLTISGEIRNEHEDTQNESKVYQREFRYGRFTRSLRLPEDIDEGAIDAELKDGFVLVTVPRKQLPESQPRRLEVRHNATTSSQQVEQKPQSALQQENTKAKK
jgi:HSP20 family protein